MRIIRSTTKGYLVAKSIGLEITTLVLADVLIVRLSNLSYWAMMNKFKGFWLVD